MPKPSAPLCRAKPLTRGRAKASSPLAGRLTDSQVLGEVVWADTHGDQQESRRAADQVANLLARSAPTSVTSIAPGPDHPDL
jgi:hypothetical protein